MVDSFSPCVPVLVGLLIQFACHPPILILTLLGTLSVD